MRPSESARAAPASAERDPRIDLLPGKIECTRYLIKLRPGVMPAVGTYNELAPEPDSGGAR
jgi:hypothetical protein